MHTTIVNNLKFQHLPLKIVEVQFINKINYVSTLFLPPAIKN